MYRICSSSMAAASSAPVAKIPPGPSWRCAGAPVTTWRTNFEKEICRWNMSSNDPVDLRQDRREWLKSSAAALGASLLPLPALSGEQPQTATPPSKPAASSAPNKPRSEEHTSELQSRLHLVCRLLLEKKKN